MDVNYTLVVPAYFCADQLKRLINQIQEVTPERYLPRKTFVVDDGSPDDETRYAAIHLDTSNFPIDLIEVGSHEGFPTAVKVGLDKVTTPYAILVHADILPNFKPQIKNDAKPPIIDPLGVLAHYITSDPSIAAVAPTTINADKSKLMYGGPRSISNMGDPHCHVSGWIYTTYRVGILLQNSSWRSVHSLDHFCVAINMDVYNSNPFDESLGHHYFFDDWCFSVRDSGKYCYWTTDAVVGHTEGRKRPEGSSSVIDSESHRKNLGLWQSRWKNSPLVELNSPRILTSVDAIIAGGL